jgi:hypothetical protein
MTAGNKKALTDANGRTASALCRQIIVAFFYSQDHDECAMTAGNKEGLTDAVRRK